MTELEWLDQQIRGEFDLLGEIAAGAWLERYPQYRAEIERLVRELTGAFDPAGKVQSDWSDEGHAVRQLIDREMERIQLERHERDLAEKFAALRDQEEPIVNPKRKRPRIYAWVVKKLNDFTTEVDLVKTAKTIDLLRRLAGISGYNFVPAPKGPLDNGLYEDAGVGRKENWLAAKRGHEVRPGPNAETGAAEAAPYLRNPELAGELMRLLAPYSGWELAVWTTVLFAAGKVLERGATVNVDAVKDAILEEEPWKEGKLDWDEFSDERIQEALGHLTRLGLIPEERVHLV